MDKNPELPLCFKYLLTEFQNLEVGHQFGRRTHSLSGIGLDSCMATQIKALTWWHDIKYNTPLISHQLHICATPVYKIMNCISASPPALSIVYLALMTSLIFPLVFL